MTGPADGLVVGLASVNVAMPGYLGEQRGETVESGILKKPVPGGFIEVSSTNLAGDGQADRVNHGGFDKAVYAYPIDHLPNWNMELNPQTPYGAGSFGENLSTQGWLEDTVFIGDIWQWGGALLQVCQPRYPCYKLAMATGRLQVVKAMVANGRTGWYLRVLESGRAPVAGPITVIQRGECGITVSETHAARLPGAALELVERVVSAPALARGLRSSLNAVLLRGG